MSSTLKEFLLLFSVAFFSIFIGSQITEGFLLLPYWQSLSSIEFYAYYNNFGPMIGKFYKILTIIAALIPIIIAIYCKSINAKTLIFALISSFFAILFVVTFYMYFKETNAMFYQAAFNDIELKNELVIWSYWHWSRIFIEFLSLFFLILTLIKMPDFKSS
jgi:hypothetical protein